MPSNHSKALMNQGGRVKNKGRTPGGGGGKGGGGTHSHRHHQQQNQRVVGSAGDSSSDLLGQEHGQERGGGGERNREDNRKKKRGPDHHGGGNRKPVNTVLPVPEPGLRGDCARSSRASSSSSVGREPGGGKREEREQNNNETRSALSPDAKPFVMRDARPAIMARQAASLGERVHKVIARRDINNNSNMNMNPCPLPPEKKVDNRSGGPELPLKHPLSYSWTLWYFPNDGKQEWEKNLREVSTFGHVEDFWALYNHILTVSELKSGCDYSLFKRGIKPMWEDRRNVDGGRWLLSQNKHSRRDCLEDRWLDTMLFLVGDNHDDEDVSAAINGAVVSVRTKVDKIGVWVGAAACDGGQQDCVRRVGGRFKRYLGLQEQIVFETHQDSMQKTGSTSKAMLRL